MRTRIYQIIFLIFLPFFIYAQEKTGNGDLTGLWKGTLYNDTTHQYYRYEVAITENKGKLSGFSHTWFLLGDKRYFGLKKVKVKKANDGKIIIEDNGLITNNYPVEPAKNVRQLNVLTLTIADDRMILEGPFSTNATKQYSSLTGSINLSKKIDYWQSDLVPHLQELGLIANLSFVQNDLAISAGPKINTNLPSLVEKMPGITEENEKKIIADSVKTIISNTGVKVPTEITKATSPEAREDEIAINTTVIKTKPVANKRMDKMESPSNVSAKSQLADEKVSPKTIVQKEVPPKNQPGVDKEPGKIVASPVKPAVANAVELKPEGKQVLVKAADKKQASLTQAPVEIKKEVVTNIAPVIKKTEANEVPARPDSKAPEIKPTVLNVELASTVKSAAMEVKARSNVVQQTVMFSSDSLQLSLFDNGEVDGDTVSVLMNGNVIVAKQRLSTNAFRQTIYIDKNQDNIELIMYAENLGSIPPNTGLLVVKDGKDIYEIRFRGDLEKNAAIILKRKR